MKHVYLDNAGTTPMDPKVIKVMNDEMINTFGNASTPNFYGRAAHAVMDQARAIIAKSINAKESEIIFTSGGSEGDNTAIIQTALSHQNLGKHIITTGIEHEAVMKSMEYLESIGFDVTYLPVDEHGEISLADLKKALTPDTILVSIMMVNNEVGSINPIKEIGELLKDHQAIFHTDAVQAYGTHKIDVKDLNVDLLTTSAHKINGPKMIGFMYERDGLNLPSYIKGGDQETKRRAGTENVPAMAGFAEAAKLNSDEVKTQNNQKFYEDKQLFIDELRKNNVDFAINGPKPNQATSNIINIWLKGFETSAMQINLDLAGYIISGGSACTAGSLEPSHVLVAMFGKDSPRVNESLRVSLNKMNSKNDILGLADAIGRIVKRN